MRDLTRRLRKIDDLRSNLLDEVGALDPQTLKARPIPGKWSILEVVEHLVLSEQDVMNGIFNPSSLQPRKRTLRDRLAFLLVMFILRFPIPVRTPSSGMVPRGKRSLGELRESWDQNLTALREFVAALDNGGLRQPVFRHPVAGPLTIRHAVAMQEVHLRRHARQIRKLENILG
jgi:hypothetical protein